MLEVTTPAVEADMKLSFPQHYRSSELARWNGELIAQLHVPKEGSEPLHFKNTRSQSPWKQFSLLTQRNLCSYWRCPPYNGVRYVSSAGIALLMGSIFWQVGNKTSQVQNIYNIVGAIYITTLFQGIIGCMTVQPVVGAERPVFFRERAAGCYGVLPFNLAQLAVEIPYILTQVSLYSLIAFFMIGFEITFVKFAWFWLITFVTLLTFTTYGLMVVSLTPNVPLATVMSSTFYGIWTLLAGFVIPAGYIPGWWKWLFYINPLGWSLHGIIVTQLGDFSSRLVQLPDGSLQPVPDFLRDAFDFKYHLRGWIVLILAGFVILFATATAVAQKVLNFQKR